MFDTHLTSSWMIKRVFRRCGSYLTWDLPNANIVFILTSMDYLHIEGNGDWAKTSYYSSQGLTRKFQYNIDFETNLNVFTYKEQWSPLNATDLIGHIKQVCHLINQNFIIRTEQRKQLAKIYIKRVHIKRARLYQSGSSLGLTNSREFTYPPQF